MSRPTVTLKFTHPTNGETSTTIPVNSVKALSEPDEFEIFPGLQHHYLNGSLDEQIKGFRRVMTVDFGVIQYAVHRNHVLYFLLDPDRQIDFDDGAGNEEVDIPVALENPGGFTNDWLEGIQLGKHYVLRLRERVIRQEFPAAWE